MEKYLAYFEDALLNVNASYCSPLGYKIKYDELLDEIIIYSKKRKHFLGKRLLEIVITLCITYKLLFYIDAYNDTITIHIYN